MADRGTQDEEIETGDAEKPAPGGGPVPESPAASLDYARRSAQKLLGAFHPDDLPQFADPAGRALLPRHKRQAVRKAKALGMSPASPNHALYLLTAEGVDVFDEGNSMLALAQHHGEIAATTGTLPMLQDPDGETALAKPDSRFLTDTERELAVSEIQRDLIRRRRRRFVGLMLRLILFVFLPTAAVGYYLFSIATDMYETESSFVIQTSENPAASGGFGAILAGTGFATSQDSIVVQDYLNSREAFRRLDAEFGYAVHFMDPSIDVIQRLPEGATADEAYQYYTKRVTIGYDPTEGVIRMSVIAATPEASQRFAEALVGYAEERVDGLSREARGDQLELASARYSEALQELAEAEARVVDLQQQRGVLSAEVELSSQMSIINNLLLEAEQRRFALAEILDNPRPNQSRAEVIRKDIARIEARIEALRAELTENGDSSVSLARISGELRLAEGDLATRQLIVAEAVSAMEMARLEANRQVRYLSLAVAPVAPAEATYPRKVESTLLAFFVFGGIYILVSLTLSILREQVSV